MQPFHLAFPVHDLASARTFYGEILGCPAGRSSALWVEFDLGGHQIVAHLAPRETPSAIKTVDGDRVPSRHFGLILEVSAWSALADRLRERNVEFLIEPRVRFAGEKGEQRTFFVCDPSGNALEFKAFTDPKRLFAS